MTRSLRYIAPVTAGVGALAFLVNLLLGAGFWKPSFELPWWDVQQVVCDGDDIHVALGYYSRIQTYDREGIMTGTWQVDNYAKPFSFRLDGSDKPVIRVRGHVPEDERPVKRSVGWRYVIEEPCGIRIGQPVLYQLFGGPVLPWMLGGLGLLLSMVLFPRSFLKLLDQGTRKKAKALGPITKRS